jgi:dTDP-4-dehydrorhamnose reductase
VRAVITGAGGLAGSALQRALPPEGRIALTHADLDVTDAEAVHAAMRRLRPEVIFNCAVIEVDACERDPEAARRMNVEAPGALADAASVMGGTLVHFSTNYVFGGDRATGHPYTTEDVPDPVNVYGATKWAGEQEVTRRCRRSFVVRTSWVYGPGKSSFLSTVASRLALGQRVQAISDTFASSTYVEDLVARVLQILERGPYGTYQVVNSGVCSYEMFAREAARLTGSDESLIDVVSEADTQRLARRPRSTPMRCLLSETSGFAAMRPWQEALAEWVGESTA